MVLPESENCELPQEIQLPESPDLYKMARNNFVAKVYTILAGQLLLTTAFVIMVMNIPQIFYFQIQNPAITIFSLLISIVCILMFAIKPNLAQKHPVNMIILAIFTLAQSYVVSAICGFYDSNSVLLAAGVTASATIGLTLYAVYSKDDFSSYWQGLTAIGWSFFLAVLFLTFINFMVNIPLISNFIALGFAVLYSAYIVIDTQLILGKRKTQLELDNYILGAMLLYLDIINLFLQILRILGKSSRE